MRCEEKKGYPYKRACICLIGRGVLYILSPTCILGHWRDVHYSCMNHCEHATIQVFSSNEAAFIITTLISSIRCNTDGPGAVFEVRAVLTGQKNGFTMSVRYA